MYAFRITGHEGGKIMSTELKEKEKFYTCRYDAAFKEVFLNEKNEEILKKLLEQSLHLKIHTIETAMMERNQGNEHARRKVLDAVLYTDQGIIGIEMNARYKGYLRVRNTAFAFDLYTHYTYRGKEYDDEMQIIQINYTYGLGKKYDEVEVYELQNKKGEQLLKNFRIIEWNMDKIMKFWYDKDEENIEKHKYLIMLDLEQEELHELSKRDEEVKKYMEEVERINQDPKFREYMTKEEDDRKIRNTELREAREQGIEYGEKNRNLEIAKTMLKANEDIKKICEYTGLTKEEIRGLIID